MIKCLACQKQFHKPVEFVVGQIVKCDNRWFHSSSQLKSKSLRNIGIMAHIDAGKTTTTERMLYYSGHITSMGDVDKGNTVTDYLPIEMERGITVQSAAVLFDWKGTSINLIDTPGHVDFTVEVERSLRVLDGAVAIFDGAKGVQSQSRTVWRQANRHSVPRLAFINKMDKPGASFDLSLASLRSELDSNFLVLQLPIISSQKFIGNIDVVELKENIWLNGKNYTSTSLNNSHKMWEQSLTSRAFLIEQLADDNDEIAEMWIDCDGDVENFPSSNIKSAIKKATLHRSCVPVLCGSSYKNIGVEPLLDAVVDYLPAPHQIQHDFLKYYEDSFSGMVFKVLHDKRLGPVVFTRVYSGSIKSGETPFNATKNISESPVKLMKADADKFVMVNSLKAGEIGIISGLKYTITGDTLVASKNSFQKALRLIKETNGNEVNAVLPTVPIPEPVFYRTVYVNSHSQEKALHEAMEIICREDPSIRMHINQQDGNLILSGMGELHIEIVADRIKKQFKIDAYIGPLKVEYREQPTEEIRHTDKYEKTMFDETHTVKVGVKIIPDENENKKINAINDILTKLPSTPKIEAAKRGIVFACRKGNLLGYPLIGATIELTRLDVSKNCPSPIISSSAIQCTREALTKAECILKQPMMEIEISTSDKTISPIIVAELSRSHADIYDVIMTDHQHVVRATSSVEDIKGFSTRLRSATSGRVDISMNISGYDVVTAEKLQNIRYTLRGSS